MDIQRIQNAKDTKKNLQKKEEITDKVLFISPIWEIAICSATNLVALHGFSVTSQYVEVFIITSTVQSPQSAIHNLQFADCRLPTADCTLSPDVFSL